MTYEQAFNKATAIITAKNPDFRGVTAETDKICALMWTILACAENKLDDFALISNNNSVISLPLNFLNEKKQDVVNEEKQKPTKQKSGKDVDSIDSAE